MTGAKVAPEPAPDIVPTGPVGDSATRFVAHVTTAGRRQSIGAYLTEDDALDALDAYTPPPHHNAASLTHWHVGEQLDRLTGLGAMRAPDTTP